jgi:putative addiction module component (TIGR02574 family)
VNVHREGVALAVRRGQTDDMRTSDLDISGLSLAERIQLAEDLWDSVAAETGELPLSAAQTAELDRRLAELARDSAERPGERVHLRPALEARGILADSVDVHRAVEKLRRHGWVVGAVEGRPGYRLEAWPNRFTRRRR